MNRSRMLQSLISASVKDNAFTMLVKTDNAGTSTNTQFTIPTSGTGYDYNVEWGDGTSDSNVNGSITHTYASAGTYTVKINGLFPTILFGNGGDKDKLIEITNWGDIQWQSLSSSFYGCSNLINVDGGDINISSVTNMGAMFYNCTSLTSLDVSSWDTSSVSDISNMFFACPFSSLDVSNWNTSSVTNMGGVFYNCTSLTSLDVSNWNTSSVTTMSSMFRTCASLATLDVSSWDTSSVTNMSAMFFQGSAIPLNPSNWIISSVTSLDFFANSTNMGTTTYDNLLVNWESQLVNNNLSPNFGNARYTAGSAAATARQALIDDHSWTITDGGSV